MALTDELKASAGSLWEMVVTHPFVVELGESSLPVEKFRLYFLQDYVFVKDLAKVVSLAMVKAPDFGAASQLSQFLQGILTSEDNLFQRAFRELGVPPEQYRKSEAAPTTRAFGDFLLRLSYEGTFEEILTALYATEGTYLDWATRLIQQGRKPQSRLYQEWIDIHSPQVLGDFVGWIESHLNSLDLAGIRPRMKDVFVTTLRYEYLFWEMAYKGEKWPDE